VTAIGREGLDESEERWRGLRLLLGESRRERRAPARVIVLVALT
jgi:hypothetical protein